MRIDQTSASAALGFPNGFRRCGQSRSAFFRAHDPATPNYHSYWVVMLGITVALARTGNRVRNRRSTGARPHGSVKVGG